VCGQLCGRPAALWRGKDFTRQRQTPEFAVIHNRVRSIGVRHQRQRKLGRRCASGITSQSKRRNVGTTKL